MTMNSLNLSTSARLMSGITLLTIPSIEYGGTFVLSLLSGAHPELNLNEFQFSMFRAGHAHAGVLVILSLICQMLIDNLKLSKFLEWFLRISFVLAAIFISGGFFASAIGSKITSPNQWVSLLYFGAGLLALALLTLGVLLIKSCKFKSSKV
ncbi:MAG: hypothetical protein SFU25_09135 [Candidatus Caenarcaniphilales bacterium]|nr:hypothetical protein [Candidatus Caenarcaniphilales bacterium]